MAKKEFILQGFTDRTHLDAVRELFGVADIERVLISVAFVSESGLQEIARELTAHAAHVVVFAGIRNDITSYQGLVRLYSIRGVSLYTVDTGSRNVMFHPKVYLVRGRTSARLVVGSANLTLGGLHNNVEASMMLDFDLDDADDKAVVQGIEARLAALPIDYPSHIVRVGAVAELDAMLASGRLVDEMAIPPPRPTTSAGGAGASDTVPRIKLKSTPLRRALQRARPARAPGAPRAAIPARAGAAAPAPVPATVGVEFELVWESKPLTRRDLTIPDAAGTHATGSVNLDKGLLPDAVDHRPYFRDDVFSALTWTRRSATVDEAFARFQLVLKGISYGEFGLPIRHTTSKTSAAYLQKNAMTRLSWGPMHEYIARPDLIGRSMALYRDKVDPRRFVIEID
jgi:HKD family nuclease